MNDSGDLFNSFFEKSAQLAKERNLILTPITLVIVSDGIPDIPMGNAKSGSKMLYEKINYTDEARLPESTSEGVKIVSNFANKPVSVPAEKSTIRKMLGL